MTEIAHQDLDRLLAQESAAPLYLVYGEEMLCQKAIQTIVNRVLGRQSPQHRLDRVDGGAPGAIAEALARINTYSLLGGAKVVLLSDSTIFENSSDTRTFLEKARTCIEQDDPTGAAKALMTVLGIHRLTIAEMDAEARRRLLTAAELEPQDDAWLEPLIERCRGRITAAPPAEDDSALLARAIEKGFPAEHHLIIGAASIDRRRKLYKSIEDAGVVINASVPAGQRRADLEIQQQLLQDQARRILGAAAKHLGTGAYEALVEMTGFDLRTFCSSLEKLVDYAGPRSEITTDDVHRVLERSKKDPIFELTGAVGDRRLDKALLFFDSILDAGIHPLQVMAALTNFVRRLVLARGFIDGPQGSCWQPQMAYPVFQRQVVAALLTHDQRLGEQIRSWHPESTDAKGKRKTKIDTDLALVKNPKSVYPVYQLFKQANGFSAEHLAKVIHRLCEVDRSLKSSAAQPRWLIESLLCFICQGSDPHRQKK